MSNSEEVDNKLVALVDAATDLAKAVHEDAKRDGKITKTTVLALNTFSRLHAEAGDLLDIMDDIRTTLQ